MADRHHVPVLPPDEERTGRLREDIRELTAENRNLRRQNDSLRKDLYESNARVVELERAAANRDDDDDTPIIIDETALKAARSRVRELEDELTSQTALCKEALAGIEAVYTEIEVANVISADRARALEIVTRERNEALARLSKAEAELARSSSPSARPATPLTAHARPAAGGLLTPATTRPGSYAEAQLRDLQLRYDALLAEKRSVESKYVQLQHKWSDFKDLVRIKLSPSKPRAGRREMSPEPADDDVLEVAEVPPPPPKPIFAAATDSSPLVVPAPLKPASPAGKDDPFVEPLPVIPASPEVVETSEPEDEDWDGQPLPTRAVTAQPTPKPKPLATNTPNRDNVTPAAIKSASRAPVTPRRARTEHILVADSSPEKGPSQRFLVDGSQTQSSSSPSQRRSAPPESPVRPRAPPPVPPFAANVASSSLMRKRKADMLSDEEDVDPTPRKVSARADQTGNVDYSVFKGHGRYRTSLPASDVPAQRINQLYEVNTEANDGVAFQYNEVVRNKQKRKQLDGGDCECCKDYYAAVGPMPPRMQPPRWRSPSESQSQGRTRGPCRHMQGRDEDDGHVPDSFEEEEGAAGPSSTAAAIAAHKNEISKHRHAWAPAETPPDYWHIGFPTTQEVNDINRKAARMHQEKMHHVAAEASKPGGKYRKKGR